MSKKIKANFWMIQRSEPTIIDAGLPRLLRTGIICQMIQSRGHNLTLWTSTFDHFKRKNRFTENKLIEVSKNYKIQFLKSFEYKKNFSIRRGIDDYVVSLNFKKTSKKAVKPNIIFVSMPSIEIAYQATKYAKKNGIPIYVEIRDLWPDIFYDFSPIYLRPLIFFVNLYYNLKLSYILKNSSGVIGITNSYLEWGLSKINKKKSPNDKVFRMSYEPKSQNNNEILKKIFLDKYKIGIEKNALVVTFIGTMGKSNNLQTIIQAAKHLSIKSLPIVFIIAGSGSELNKIKDKSKDMNNIYFTDWIEKDEIEILLSISDVGLLPYVDSKNYKLNIPNKPSEYMSRGLVLALSLCHGEMMELIKDRGIGFTYDSNYMNLVNQLIRLANNKNLVLEMKRKSLNEFNQNYRSDKVYNDLIDFLEERMLLDE